MVFDKQRKEKSNQSNYVTSSITSTASVTEKEDECKPTETIATRRQAKRKHSRLNKEAVSDYDNSLSVASEQQKSTISYKSIDFKLTSDVLYVYKLIYNSVDVPLSYVIPYEDMIYDPDSWGSHLGKYCWLLIC